MAVEVGTHLGPYEIVAPLGKGGMGEVWRAKDTRLGREVALKFLPADFADDPERHARFEREAKLLAALNHPNIAVLYGLEHLDGQRALAMEFVEGEGLDERIGRGAIPVEEAILIAVQIARALEAAHEKGIVHRDLKPANVKVRPDGTVKVLDFGLAKGWEEEASRSDPAYSPTIAGHHTRAGVILGTAAYMSPEQARGKSVDKRADIWAFGCVLFEMLAGRSPFAGETVSDTLAAVLTKEPDWGCFPPDTPTGVAWLLQRCLEREPRRRLPDAGVAPLLLEFPMAAASSRPPTRRGRWLAVGGAAALLAGGGTFLALRVVPTSSASSRPPGVQRLRLTLPDGSLRGFAFATVSPDGRSVVLSSLEDSDSLWLRPLAADEARPIPGTEGGELPFWSPDSRSVGFFTQAALKRVDLATGTLSTICATTQLGRGGTWNRDGEILFAPRVLGTIWRVPAGGGTPTELTTFDEGRRETTHRWPRFLPDGKHFLYFGSSGTASGGGSTVYVSSLDGRERRPILEDVLDATYASGHLLTVEKAALMARPFDPERGVVRGPAVPIAENVMSGFNVMLSGVSASDNGVLTYVGIPSSITSTLQWLDRTGGQAAKIGPEDRYYDGRLSPDGRQVAIAIGDERSFSDGHLWSEDAATGARSRLTFGSGSSVAPVWSPDGSQIAFANWRDKKETLRLVASAGSGPERSLLEPDLETKPTDWSPDGRYLLLTVWNSKAGTNYDLWLLPMTGDHKPVPFLSSEADETDARFSPDARFVAYASDATGRDEVYVQTFPDPAGKWQVSTDGGRSPTWRRDGRELFFLSPDGHVMASEVTPGMPFRATTPTAVGPATLAVSWPAFFFDVSPDGRRILATVPTSPVRVPPVRLVLGWPSLLEKR